MDNNKFLGESGLNQLITNLHTIRGTVYTGADGLPGKIDIPANTEMKILNYIGTGESETIIEFPVKPIYILGINSIDNSNNNITYCGFPVASESSVKAIANAGAEKIGKISFTDKKMTISKMEMGWNLNQLSQNSTIYYLIEKPVSGTPSGMHNYSTEEQVVGTWIDGKPIYEIVLDFGNNITISSSSDTPFENQEIFRELNCERFFNAFFMLDGEDYHGVYIPIELFIYGDSFRYKAFETWNARDHRYVKLCFQYTKTTD